MPAIVVLGMHRSGTSLVANMLRTMGVDMGEELMGPAPSNPQGHFEDVEFVKLNERILRAVGASWASPPPEEVIRLAGRVLAREVARVVASKQRGPLPQPLPRQAGEGGKIWGWKDPRTCLTAELFHPHLQEPRYVWVRRERDAVVRSLLERDGGHPSHWMGLFDEYERRVEEFLRLVDAPRMVIGYEDLVDEADGPLVAEELAAFVGTDRLAAEDAFRVVETRETWPGFGRVAVGVPYFKSCYYWWRWWSWLLVDGLEAGDEFLNDWDVPGEVPLPMAHNALVRKFLKTDCDTLLIIEDDHEGDQDVVRRMRFKAENWPFDVVCASYVNRRAKPVPVGWNFTGQNTARGRQVQFKLDEVALEGTQEYDGAALGLVFIRRRVLEEMAQQGGVGDADLEEFFWFNSVGANSLDIDFYARAQEVGARVGVDRDEWIGHVGQKVWTKADFVRARAALMEKAAEEAPSLDPSPAGRERGRGPRGAGEGKRKR